MKKESGILEASRPLVKESPRVFRRAGKKKRRKTFKIDLEERKRGEGRDESFLIISG